MRNLLVLLALVPSLACADVFVADAKNSYRRLDKPCVDKKVLQHIPPAAKDGWKAGILVYEGKTLSSCWIERQGAVFSVDEKGDMLVPLPTGGFRDDTI